MPLYPFYIDKYRQMSTFWTARFKYFNTIEHVLISKMLNMLEGVKMKIKDQKALICICLAVRFIGGQSLLPKYNSIYITLQWHHLSTTASRITRNSTVGSRHC